MLVCPPIRFPLSLSLPLRRYGSGWVVTQAALNGVARYAGHALQIMALVRPAAPSAFEGLRQLVDLYVYCAFTLFCPQWAIDGECLRGSDSLSSSSSSSSCRPLPSGVGGILKMSSDYYCGTYFRYAGCSLPVTGTLQRNSFLGTW